MTTVPPTPPRPFTAAASRCAWLEPRVRFWWTAALALLALAAVFAVEQTIAWMRLRALIDHGRPVTARIVEVEGFNRSGRPFPSNSIVRIKYTIDGHEYDFNGPLEARAAPVQVGDELALRVDPNDPENWTLRTEMVPVGHYLIGGALMLPVLLGGVAATLVQRALVVRAWKHNPAIEVTVVGTRQSPLAPRSRLLRCTPGRIGNLRIVYVYLPRTAGAPANGETIWVVPLGTKATHALAVKAFDRNG